MQDEYIFKLTPTLVLSRTTSVQLTNFLINVINPSLCLSNWTYTYYSCPSAIYHCTKICHFLMILHILRCIIIMKIISHNCRGLPNHPDNIYLQPCVEEILNKNDVDIVCLQETWYSKQDIAILNTLQKNFHGIGLVKPVWTTQMVYVGATFQVEWLSCGDPLRVSC